jgi:hypothetical protein
MHWISHRDTSDTVMIGKARQRFREANATAARWGPPQVWGCEGQSGIFRVFCLSRGGRVAWITTVDPSSVRSTASTTSLGRSFRSFDLADVAGTNLQRHDQPRGSVEPRCPPFTLHQRVQMSVTLIHPRRHDGSNFSSAKSFVAKLCRRCLERINSRNSSGPTKQSDRSRHGNSLTLRQYPRPLVPGKLRRPLRRKRRHRLLMIPRQIRLSLQTQTQIHL